MITNTWYTVPTAALPQICVRVLRRLLLLLHETRDFAVRVLLVPAAAALLLLFLRLQQLTAVTSAHCALPIAVVFISCYSAQQCTTT